MDHKVLFDSVEVVHYEEKKTPPVLIEDICEKNQRLISKNTASKSAFATARYHLKLKFKTSSENNKKRQRPTVIPASTDLCPTNWIFFLQPTYCMQVAESPLKDEIQGGSIVVGQAADGEERQTPQRPSKGPRKRKN